MKAGKWEKKKFEGWSWPTRLGVVGLGPSAAWWPALRRPGDEGPRLRSFISTEKARASAWS